MKIVESDVSLHSAHEAEYRRSVEVETSRSFRTVMAEVRESEDDAGGGRRQRLAKMLESLVDAILAAMEGKSCRQEAPGLADLTAGDARPGRPVREMAWETTARESIYDYERTRVVGGGAVCTADGRRIDFSLDAEFCREFSCEREVKESGTVVLRDPIVLDFAGKAAELTAERIDFDLDLDGRNDTLAGLGQGSAYLVLDRNGNGRIDDGGELFGAASGDGFADLARLDDDHNGWLDEGDAAFARLGLWSGRSGDGSQPLASREVGAIWLGRVDSPFALKDDANRLLGEIRAAGLYLKEDGAAGLVQQVDLAAAAPPAAGEERVPGTA